MRNYPQVKYRLPEELKAWLEEQAKKNHRSNTAELIHRLSEDKKREEQAAA
ncbi:Arc family DNA-binding protein [Pseudomonas sp. 21LCFQ02]|uniref:Arc family DNA-binding protein n=1 Tax=Pseudomonas sp. 21LCFQ02 TaxID=2957505 RepID=UPI00209B32C9|nr:Arc family DNA-binding protein [Pseudomonas sp. 21LCFQ02]MCO8166818.1 Arc family DNA-binding protein [Pseudomonas sp. 21LCFQ02]